MVAVSAAALVAIQYSTIPEDAVSLVRKMWSIASSPITWILVLVAALAVSLLPEQKWESFCAWLGSLKSGISRARTVRSDIDFLGKQMEVVARNYPRICDTVEWVQQRDNYESVLAALANARSSASRAVSGGTAAGAIKAGRDAQAILDLLEPATDDQIALQRAIANLDGMIEQHHVMALKNLLDQMSLAIDDVSTGSRLEPIPERNPN